MPSDQQLPAAQEARRRTVADAQGTAVQNHHVWGEVKVSGPGEGIIPIGFPVTFVKKPGFSFGAELLDDQPRPGRLPTVSACVIQWTKQRVVNGDYFGGMLLAVVCTGLWDNLSVHWHCEGLAFKNPTQYDGKVQSF